MSGAGAVSGKHVVYAATLVNGLRLLCPDAQMTSHKPHGISSSNGRVEVCGILLSSQITSMLYPTPDLGGNLDYAQEEGNLFYLLILLHYHLYTISVYRSRVPLPSHELYGFPCVESLTSPGSCQAVTMVPLHIVLRIECVPVF